MNESQPAFEISVERVRDFVTLSWVVCAYLLSGGSNERVKIFLSSLVQSVPQRLEASLAFHASIQLLCGLF